MLDKNKNSARGAQINCVNFQLCPFCYGCRNFRSDDLECQECKRLNEKKNICNTTKHKEDVVTKMIIKPKIEIPVEHTCETCGVPHTGDITMDDDCSGCCSWNDKWIPKNK